MSLFSVEGQTTLILHNPELDLCRTGTGSTYLMRLQRSELALRLVSDCAITSLIHARCLLCPDETFLHKKGK